MWEGKTRFKCDKVEFNSGYGSNVRALEPELRQLLVEQATDYYMDRLEVVDKLIKQAEDALEGIDL